MKMSKKHTKKRHFQLEKNCLNNKKEESKAKMTDLRLEWRAEKETIQQTISKQW